MSLHVRGAPRDVLGGMLNRGAVTRETLSLKLNPKPRLSFHSADDCTDAHAATSGIARHDRGAMQRPCAPSLHAEGAHSPHGVTSDPGRGRGVTISRGSRRANVGVSGSCRPQAVDVALTATMRRLFTAAACLLCILCGAVPGTAAASVGIDFGSEKMTVALARASNRDIAVVPNRLGRVHFSSRGQLNLGTFCGNPPSFGLSGMASLYQLQTCLCLG